MKDYTKIANILDNLMNELLYDSMDMSNVTILSYLAGTIKEVEDDELTENKILKKGCESDLISDRLEQAFFDKEVREVFYGMLLEYEKFELLAEFKKMNLV